MDFTVLGLFGPAGSGKDLVADWFWVEKGFTKVAFADPMKRFAKQAFNFSSTQLWGPSEERNREFVVDDAWWFEAIGHFGEASKEIVENVLGDGNRVEGYLKLHDWLSQLRKDYREKISARVVLQTLGTEWGRYVDPLMWVNYCYRTIDAIKSGDYAYSQYTGLEVQKAAPSAPNGIVIPDHRFLNEVSTSQDRGSYVMRLRRLALEPKEVIGVPGHQSEAEQKTISDGAFDLVMEFEEGVEKVYGQLARVYAEELWKMKRASNRS